MINEAGLDQLARQMRLGVPDDVIVRQITEQPFFRGPTGQFDAAASSNSCAASA